MREPPADTDTIPAGYMTPPKARPCQTEVRTHAKFAAPLHEMHPAFSTPPMAPRHILEDGVLSYCQACMDTPNCWCRNGMMRMTARWKAA